MAHHVAPIARAVTHTASGAARPPFEVCRDAQRGVAAAAPHSLVRLWVSTAAPYRERAHWHRNYGVKFAAEGSPGKAARFLQLS